MKKERKPASREEHARRMYVWGHNALLGSATMMQKQANSIINSPSTTDRAKAMAMTIRNVALDLAVELKTRIDP